MQAGGAQLMVSPTGELDSVDQIGAVIVAETQSGSPVCLRELGVPWLTYQSPPTLLNHYLRKNERGEWIRHPAITLGVQMRDGEQIAEFGSEVARTLAEFQERLLGKLEGLLEDMLDHLKATYKEIPAGSRPVAFGILFDKVQLLKNQPTSFTASAHVHITAENGKVREVARGEIASVLMGRAGRGHGNGRTVDHSGQAAGAAGPSD